MTTNHSTCSALFAGLAASALLLSACTGGEATPDATSRPEPDPGASAIIRLVLEPGNLDIRETAGAAPVSGAAAASAPSMMATWLSVE